MNVMQQKNGVRRVASGVGLGAVFGILGILGCAEDRNEKISSIYALKAEPSEANQEEIRRSLDDPDRDIRATALNALVTLRVHDAAALARAGLLDEDPFVRATAAKLLGDSGDETDAQRLVAVLEADSDPIARLRSAEALQRVGGPLAVAGLTRALSDPDEHVRLAAVRAVRELDPESAKPALARLVLEDPMYEVRVQAARALGTTGDIAVLPVLEAALVDPNEFVRAAASNALRVHRAVREESDAAPKLVTPETEAP